MFKITWDKETGGVKLSSKIDEFTLGTAPRPVFYEELDFLGLNKMGWKYPCCSEPLLWACNKQYFHIGQLVFEVKGANIYDKATVILQPQFKNLTLAPIDIIAMLKKNKDEMFLLESEAIEFIRDTYLQYSSARKSVEDIPANQINFETLAAREAKITKKKMAIVKQDCGSFDIMPLETAIQQSKRVYQTTKIDKFIASFSGGKDSQVVLDLCTRAIPPSAFEVIYSDTGYELPSSFSLYQEIKTYYNNKYPELIFSTAKNHESVLNYWDKIGTPSDTHRWCCSVMKTAPLYRMLKIEGTNKQARVLTFDGVRAEESTRRSNYERIGKGVKHDTVINARPILEWNTVEIFMYLLKYGLTINSAYRQGMTRVGCLICPFGSEWNEMLVNVHYKKLLEPFIKKVEQFAIKSGVKDVEDYIRQGGWKRRASGKDINQDSFIEFKSIVPRFFAQISNPKKDILAFLQTLGPYSVITENNTKKGKLKIKDTVYFFTIIKKDKNVYDFEMNNILDAQLIGLLKRVLYKSTYCINCEACEVECPTGALSVYPIIKIDNNKCIHCHKCLEHNDKGCIVANSLNITTGNMKQTNIDRYKNFGLKTDWVELYLNEKDNFWTSNHGLNKDYQIPALKCWLKDAEIIDEKNNITELGNLLANIRIDFPDLVWEIIWINLSYNSFIVDWFTRNIKCDTAFSAPLLEEMIKEQYPSYKDKTIHNAVYQLQRTLKESPIGLQFSQFEQISRESIKRNAYIDISPESVAYSLYKYAKYREVTSLRVSDLYKDDVKGSIVKEFCVPKSVLEKDLRTLNSAKNRVLVAELNMGLDSISLREDLNPLSALKILVD